MTNIPLDPIAQLVAKYQSNGHQVAPSQQQKKSRTGFVGKTLWDWLNLLGVLLVPLVLGAGTILISAQQSAISQRQHEVDLGIANNQLQESILKTFRDDIDHLVFDQRLLTAKPGDPVQIMAQSYTNDALRKLDLPRKALLVQFIHDLHLIAFTSESSSLISLIGADLRRTDLSWSDLGGANLHGANMYEAVMHETDLHGANLSNINLPDTNLYEAELDGADLREALLEEATLTRAALHGADLSGAEMDGAELYEADLSGADLYNAKVTPEQLARAWSLKDATLPDGSHYPSSSYPIPNHQEPRI